MPALREANGGREHPVEKAAVVIGRAPACDIVLNSPRVSARHASITHRGDDWFIEDLGSSNGTRVNGRRIQERTRLRNGDRIDVFDVSLVFQDAPDVVLVESPQAAPS